MGGGGGVNEGGRQIFAISQIHANIQRPRLNNRDSYCQFSREDQMTMV